MSQLIQHPASLQRSGFTGEEADQLRSRYGTALQYIILPSKEHHKPGHPFYMMFAQSLRYREVGEDSPIPVAAVGFEPKSPTGSLYLNVPVCNKFKLKELAGVVVHELLHVILGHVHINSHFRRRYPQLFAIAIDLVVNQMVVKDGYALPTGKGYLADPNAELDPVTLDSVERIVGKRPPAHESVEFYCEWLKTHLQDENESDSEGEGQEESAGASGGVSKPGLTGKEKETYLYEQTHHAEGLLDEDNETLSEAEREIIRRTVAQNVRDAVANSGGLGSLPGSIQLACQSVIAVLEPKVRLEQLLSTAIGGAGRMEGYLRRNRLNRYHQPGLYGFKPSLALGIVADVSGSVSRQELGYAFGVCQTLANQAGIEVFIQQASDGNLDEIKPLAEVIQGDQGTCLGSGGTDMRPAVLAFQEEIDQQGPYRVGAIFVLTDGELDERSKVLPHEVDVPVYWLSCRSKTVPFTASYAGEWYWFSPETGEVTKLD